MHKGVFFAPKARPDNYILTLRGLPYSDIQFTQHSADRVSYYVRIAVSKHRSWLALEEEYGTNNTMLTKWEQRFPVCARACERECERMILQALLVERKTAGRTIN